MPAPLHLNPVEERLLGVLIEKSLTTPEQYPLTLNALSLGANQKSNRDPVLSLGEAEVLVGLDGLRVKQLAGSASAAGGRVERFRHNGEAALEVTTPELAVLAELLLRGSQAPGELRARVSRMVPLAGLDELEALLRALSEKGYARRLAPAPGSRAPRYAHRLGPESPGPDDSAAEPTDEQRFRPVPRSASGTPGTPGTTGATGEPGTPDDRPSPPANHPPVPEGEPLTARVAALETELGDLRRRLTTLEEALGMTPP